MPTSIVTSTDLIRTVETVTVYLREKWTDAWAEEEYLYCDWCVWSASPNISSAGFSWDFGVLMRQREDSFDIVDPLDKRGWWVKVEIDMEDGNFGYWYGRIEDEERDIKGAMVTFPASGPSAPDRTPKGKQALLAYGMDAVLDLDRLTHCWARHWSTGADVKIGRALPFNDRHQRENDNDGFYNRSLNIGSKGIPIFADDLTLAEPWSTRDIVKYLIAYHPPQDYVGNPGIPIELDSIKEQYLPNWDEPYVEWHGKTLREIFNDLIDRRRLMSWFVDVEEVSGGTDKVIIKPFTFLESDITLPGSGNLILANGAQQSLDFDAAVDIASASYKIDDAAHYDQVIARGDRILCVGTIDYTDWLIQGWTTTQESDYNTAASSAPFPTPYAATDPMDTKQKANALVRGREDLSRVFSHFVLDIDNWDGTACGGSKLFPDGAAILGMIPIAADESPWYMQDLQFENSLPFRSGYDYGGDKIATDSVTADLIDGESWEYLRSLVFVQVDTNKWINIERMDSVGSVVGEEGNGLDWSASVRVLDDGPGIAIRISGGPQHMIAKTDFAPTDADIQEVVVDFRTDLKVTFAMRADWYVEKRYPETITDPVSAVRRMEINVPERAQLHYVCPGTVVGTENAGTLVTSTGGFMRDDREWLEDLARLAFEWYGQERRALNLSYRQGRTKFGVGPASEFLLGDLITEIGKDETLETIRTVITQIRMDFAQQEGDTHKTTIQTQWAELDPVALL